MDFRIQVPDPCQEDWNGMLPHANGRYCGTCDTVVPDLSRTSDADLIELVRSKTLPHCARFAQGQLDRVMRPQPDPVARMQALVLAAAVVTIPAAADAPDPIENDPAQKKETSKKPKKLFFKAPSTQPSEYLLVPRITDTSFHTLGFSVIRVDEAVPMPIIPPIVFADLQEGMVTGAVAPMEEPTFYGFARVESAQRLPDGRMVDPDLCDDPPAPVPNAVIPDPVGSQEEPPEPARPALLAVFFRHQRTGGSLRHWLMSVFGTRTRV